MRYHLDEDGSQVVAALGRDRYGLDITSSHESGLEGMTDAALLRLGGLGGRCVVTKNGQHSIPLTHRFQADDLPHAGVLVVPPSIENDEFDKIARALS